MCMLFRTVKLPQLSPHPSRCFAPSAFRSCTQRPTHVAAPSFAACGQIYKGSSASRHATVGASFKEAAEASGSEDGRRVPLSFTGQVVSKATNLVWVVLDSGQPGGQPSVKEDSGTQEGDQLLLCTIRSLLWKMRKKALVGDRVVVRDINWKERRAVVEDILPRESELRDPRIANVNHALLVFALEQPQYDESQLSRFLVSMEASGIDFSLVLNKADLIPRETVLQRVRMVRGWGYNPILVSCETGLGVDQVEQVLQGKTSVVAGPSGAGKSSLINAIRLGRHRPDQESYALSEHEFWELDEDEEAEHESEVGTLSSDSLSSSLLLPAEPSLSSLPGSLLSTSSSGLGLGPSVTSSSSSSQKRSSPGKSASSSGPEHGSTSSSGQAGLSTGLPPGQSAGQAGQGGLPGMGSEAASDSDDFEPDFLVVGEMSRIGRGMHTTTSAQLMRLKGGGKLADTPGFSQPTLERIESTQLAAYFPEFVARMERQPCRFNDCKHLAEPGCSITGISSEDAASLFEAPSAAELDLLALSPEMLEALEEGMMDSDALRVQSVEEKAAIRAAFAKDAATAQGFWRYRYYLKFLEEIMDRENRDVKFKQVARREREGQAKVKHGKGGKQRLEAMLNNKKHRGSARQRDGRATRESLDS